MLEITDLVKKYGKDKVAVNHVSLTVNAGDIFGFIGHNGAGKSTTIKSVVGVLPFDEGDIKIDGHSIKKEPILCKKMIAYIPDNPDLYDHLTGIQYLNFVADIYEVGIEERKERIQNYGERLEIIGDLGKTIGSYSHGMKQKVAIISALIHQPKLLVLDEPFVGLDPKASRTLKDIMGELCEEGTAIFFSTHVLEVAEKLCNRIAIIKQGQIIATGVTEEIVKDKSLEDVFLEVVEDEE